MKEVLRLKAGELEFQMRLRRHDKIWEELVDSLQ